MLFKCNLLYRFLKKETATKYGKRVEKIDLSVPIFLSLHCVKALDIGKEQSMGLYLPLCQEGFFP